MLHPHNNRINFGHTLRPIEGYELDYALGTSYTLDLEAIMFLPVSLFFGEDLNIEKQCSNELLTALTQVPKKVQLFCQRGKITAPWFYHNILEFWGDNIEQVQMEEYSQSFHPKIWLIRYVSIDKKKKAKYRFICTSRNLTKSSDWDVAVVLEGEIGKGIVEDNRPLHDFIRFLDSNAKRKIKKELIAEILSIRFELSPGQERYQFFPIGNAKQHPLISAAFKSTELLVISPFLHGDSIRSLAKKTKSLTVLSTAYELDKLPMSIKETVDKFYQFNPLLEEEPALAGEDGSMEDLSDSTIDDEVKEEYAMGNSLHAKLYVTRQGKQVCWYVGSANCTEPAFSGRNIEFLTAITSTEKYMASPQALLEQLTEADNKSQGIFIWYDKEEQHANKELEQMELDLRRTIFDISSLEIITTVEENDQKLFDYKIQIQRAAIYKKKNWQIFVQPLSGMKGPKTEVINTAKAQTLYFENYELHRLTPYFLFTIKEEAIVLKTMILKLDINFPDDRMRKVFSSLVGDWSKLMKYLSFLLTKEQVEPLVDLTDEGNGDQQKKATHGWQEQFPLYEKLLVAASRDISSIKQTIKVVEMLSDEKDIDGNPLIEDSFKQLIETFKEIIPEND